MSDPFRAHIVRNACDCKSRNYSTVYVTNDGCSFRCEISRWKNHRRQFNGFDKKKFNAGASFSRSLHLKSLFRFHLLNFLLDAASSFF